MDKQYTYRVRADAAAVRGGVATSDGIQPAIIGGTLAEELGKRAYLIFYNPEDGHFLCMVQEADHSVSSYSPQKPSPNCPPLDNVLGETTTEGILRVLEIPGELLEL